MRQNQTILFVNRRFRFEENHDDVMAKLQKSTMLLVWAIERSIKSILQHRRHLNRCCFDSSVSGLYLTRSDSRSVFSAPNNGPLKKALSSKSADMVDGFQKLALESRFGIPIIYETAVVHGNNNVYGDTIFLHSVSLRATRSVGFPSSNLTLSQQFEEVIQTNPLPLLPCQFVTIAM